LLHFPFFFAFSQNLVLFISSQVVGGVGGGVGGGVSVVPKEHPLGPLKTPF